MHPSKLHLALVAAAALLVGCASPILQLEGRGYSLADSPPLKGVPASMSQSLQKLDYFHARYYEAIRDQQTTVQNTSAGLIWLGAGVMALAAGHASSDAILGTALLGGTTYAVTRAQLDARRVDVWREGMEALDCAKEASIPLDIGDRRVGELQDARNQLGDARVAVQQVRNRVQEEVDKVSRSQSPRVDAACSCMRTAP